MKALLYFDLRISFSSVRFDTKFIEAVQNGSVLWYAVCSRNILNFDIVSAIHVQILIHYDTTKFSTFFHP